MDADSISLHGVYSGEVVEGVNDGPGASNGAGGAGFLGGGGGGGESLSSVMRESRDWANELGQGAGAGAKRKSKGLFSRKGSQDYRHLEEGEGVSTTDAGVIDIEVNDDPTTATAALTLRQNIVLYSYVTCITLFGVIDRVAYKIMMVPMKNYAVFVNSFNAIMHVMFYASVVAVKRYYIGADPDSYTYPKWWIYIICGFLDSAANLLGYFGAAWIAGPFLPLLAESILPFSILAGVVILHVRYGWGEYGGAVIVMLGAVVMAIPTFTSCSGDDDAQCGPGPNNFQTWFAVCIYFSGSLPTAFSFTLREYILKEKPTLDVFHVGMMITAWQVLFSVLFFPLVMLPWFGNIPFSELGDYFYDGWWCFVGVTTSTGGDTSSSPSSSSDMSYSGSGVTDGGHGSCYGDPWAPIIYSLSNIALNVAIFLCLRLGSTVLVFMGFKLSIPFAVLLFYINLPLVPASPFSYWTLVALVVAFIGIFVYRWSNMKREAHERAKWVKLEEEGYGDEL